MQKTARAPSNPLVIICGVAIVVVGIALFSTGIGVILGVPVMLTGFFITKKRKVWRCENCGYSYEVS